MNVNNISAFPSYHFKKLSTEKSEQMLEEVQEKGMTLRDHFAGLAMQSLIKTRAFNDDFLYIEKISRKSYEYADYMLKERKDY